MLTPGQRHDATQAGRLLSGLRPRVVIADRGYDTDRVRAHVEALGAEVVIPPTANRSRKPPYDRALYRERNAVERCVARLKQSRRVATRYEKTARNYGAFVHVAALMLLLQ